MSSFLDDFEITPEKSGPTGPTIEVSPESFPNRGKPQGNFEQDFEVAPSGPYRGANLGPLAAKEDDSVLSPEAVAARNLTGGFGKGVMDVVNTGAQGIGFLTNHVTKFLADRGIGGYSSEDSKKEQARLEALNKRVEQENRAYEAKYGDSYVASGGRLGGNLLASAPMLAVGGEIPTGVAALTRVAAPSVARTVAPYVTNPLVRYGIMGPIEGSIGSSGTALATSSANPEPVGQQLEQAAKVGAALGPAGPAVYDTAKYVGGAIKGLISPFTNKGQQRLATNAVSDLAGNSTPQVASHQIIPGSVPTLAEATADPGIATLQRQARDLNPTPFVQREDANNTARLTHLARVTGNKGDIDAAQSALDTQAKTAVNTLFKPGQVADSAPVVAEIDSILNGPSGKRDSVVTALNKVRSQLINKDGSLEADPEVLYNSVRKGIADQLDKSPANSPAGQQAQRELMQVRDVLDDRITKAVPGFDNYLADYHQAAKPIDAMRYLQGLNLTDSKGNITLAKVDNALKSIEKQRNAAGVNPAKSLDQQHLDALHDLREDLIRAQHTQLGISKGSPTAQNLATQSMIAGLLPGPSKALAPWAAKIDPRLAGAGVGGYVGNLFGGPVAGVAGSGVGGLVGQVVGDSMKSRNAQVMSKVEDLLLNPNTFVPPPISRGQNLPLQGLLSRLIASGASRPLAPSINQAP